MVKSFFYIIILWLFSSCMGFAIKKNILGNYYLIAIDVEEELSLSYHDSSDGSNYATIIESCVFSLSYNDKYIVVQQHPRIFPNSPNKNITDFFILPIKNGMDWKTKNGLLGPLTQNEFLKKQKELKIFDLKLAYYNEHLK